MPETTAPWSAATRRKAPLPQPASSTVWPARRPARLMASSYDGRICDSVSLQSRARRPQAWPLCSALVGVVVDIRGNSLDRVSYGS